MPSETVTPLLKQLREVAVCPEKPHFAFVIEAVNVCLGRAAGGSPQQRREAGAGGAGWVPGGSEQGSPRRMLCKDSWSLLRQLSPRVGSVLGDSEARLEPLASLRPN